ncbi:MAG TPA: PP2C family serine/threonine-protein phosphatase [Burkholderiaceae bacterium]|nr:PP2C family serine/threonine-protein phosphatase [Burkholderiaceae bacterium]
MTRELSADRRLEFQMATLSEIGDRQTNQDAHASMRKEGLACFVVSDGAGGHTGGEIASNLVVTAVIDSFVQEQSFGVRALQFYVNQAINNVAHGKSHDRRLKDMSATVAALLIDNDNRSALWAHLGDTRVYVFRDKKIHRVTRDHSLVQQFVDAGYCAPDALRTHPQRSVLYAAVGTDGDTIPEVTQEAIQLQEGDAFLLCTDGFWERLNEVDMEQCLESATSADDWLRRMRQIVENNGNKSPKLRDNYTAQALWFIDGELETK